MSVIYYLVPEKAFIMKGRQLITLVLITLLSAPCFGQNLWDKIYLNSHDPSSQTNYRVPYCWDTSHGGLIGYVTDSMWTGSIHTVYFRLSSSGDTIWTVRDIFRTSGHERATSICQMANGDFLIAAICDTFGSPAHSRSQALLKRIDSGGNDIFTMILRPLENGLNNIQVVKGDAGSYYVASCYSDYYYPTGSGAWVVDSIKEKTFIEKYNAVNVRIAVDSILSGNMISFSGNPPCPASSWPLTGTRYADYGLIRNLTIKKSADEGLFFVFNRDTLYTFSMSSCSYYVKPGALGGFVYKYDSALQFQWSANLAMPSHVASDSLFVVQCSYPTADSGIIVVGSGPDSSNGGGYCSTLKKLNKNGLVTDVLQTPKLVFRYGTETSKRENIFETRYWTGRYGWNTGLILLDKHFNFLRYSPFSTRNLSPFSTDDFSLEGLTANQYGGAFAPYYKDTSFWISAQNVIPASINFDSLLNRYPTSVSGKVVRDDNMNCIYNLGIDLPIANRILKVTNVADSSTFYTSTDANGNWKRGLPVGAYNVSHINLSANKGIECPVTGYTAVNLPLPGTRLSGYNFYDTLRPNYKDLKVLMWSSRFRPGFTTRLYVYVINNSGSAISDTLGLVAAAGLTYVSAAPSPVSSSGNAYTWAINRLGPDSISMIMLDLTTPASTPIGTGLTFAARINEPLDAFPRDNVDTLITKVSGSYDPNCKTVNRPLFTTVSRDWVYTVEFQNTGNYAAQDVVISDWLHPMLDPTTLRVLGASPSVPTLVWGEGNQLQFRFDNINLADVQHDEAGSYGFVSYSINPSALAKVGDTITNAASIYFDYNVPIFTDTTFNILVQPLNVVHRPEAYQFLAYPNPSTGNLIILSNIEGEATLFDIQGRRMAHYNVALGKRQIHLPEGLNPGVYVLEGRGRNGELLGVVRVVTQ